MIQDMTDLAKTNNNVSSHPSLRNCEGTEWNSFLESSEKKIIKLIEAGLRYD